MCHQDSSFMFWLKPVEFFIILQRAKARSY